MNCEDVHEQFIQSLGQQGESDLPQALAEHVAQCAECQSMVDAIRAMHPRLLAVSTTQDQFRHRSIVADVMSRIMRHQRRKSSVRRIGLAVAACMLLGVGIWMLFFATGNVTLAEVQQALATQTWIHIRSDSGDTKEQWNCPSEGVYYETRFDGDVMFVDDRTNLRRWYSVLTADISESEATEYPPGTKLYFKPSTVAEYWAKEFDRMSKEPGNYQQHAETIDGRRLVRFDCYTTDALGQRMLLNQLWVDATTHLPVKDKERLQSADRDEWHREWQTDEYDFPSAGPSDMYALGVPKNTPIIPLAANAIAPAVKELIEHGKEEKAKFPPRYRTVSWQDSPDGMIDIFYQDGNKVRLEHYFRKPLPYLARPGQKPLVAPITEEKVLDWATMQTPIDLEVVDGEREYSRENVVDPPATQPTVQVYLQRGDSDLLPEANRPLELMWPYLRIGSAADIINTSDVPPGCIGFRFGEEGNRHAEYIVDPQKGYACVKAIGWEKHGEKLEKWFEDDLLDMHLVGGQWCPGKLYSLRFGDKTRGIGSSEYVTIIVTRVLDEADFPPNIFDGKLVMQAKVEGY